MKLKEILAGLTLMCGSVCFAIIGPEGAGKSTLTKELEAAFPDIANINFGKALVTYLDYLETSGLELQKVLVAREAIKRRDKKSIDPGLIENALRFELRRLAEKATTVIALDGFPRTIEQSLRTSEIFKEFFPGCLMITAEVFCDQREAFSRAVSRKGPTDTVDNISRCHKEYFDQLPQMRELYFKWSHHLCVDSSGSQENTVAHFVKILENLVSALVENPRLCKTAGSIPELSPV